MTLAVDTTLSRAPEDGTVPAFIPDSDMPGGVYKTLPAKYTDPHECAKTCEADKLCFAWTFTVKPNTCQLKNADYQQPRKVPGWATGCVRKCDEHRIGVGTDFGKPMLLKRGEAALSLRVLVDNSVLEVFGQEGRESITRRAYPKHASSGGLQLVYTGAAADAPTVSITAWAMASGRL